MPLYFVSDGLSSRRRVFPLLMGMGVSEGLKTAIRPVLLVPTETDREPSVNVMLKTPESLHFPKMFCIFAVSKNSDLGF